MRKAVLTVVKFIAFSLCSLLFCQAQAADIKVEGTTITLSGEIVAGDANTLLDAIEKAEAAGLPNIKLSLNSNGGNFQEGLKMSKRLGGHSVGTIVKAGNVCQSACALVFLGGSQNAGEAESDPDRTLEVGAQLGFHAPYIDSVKGKSTVTVEIGDLTQRMTEELKSLNKHLISIGVPESMLQSLLINDNQHTLYDATSMEAIELLNIRVPELDSEVIKVTQAMAVDGCINGFRYAQNELPSKTSALDHNIFAQISKKYKITMPEGKSGGFALIPATRQKSGDVAVCKMAVDGVCQGFYDLDSIFHYSNDLAQIPEFVGCQRENIGTALVPPQTLLRDLKATLGKLQQGNNALLEPGTVIAPDPEDRPDLQVDNTLPAATDAVICNTRENTKFANVREGPNGKEVLVIALPNETPVKIVGEAKNPDTNHVWKKIAFGGRTGFVDNELLSPICLVALAPVKPPPAVVARPVQSRAAVVCNRKPGGDSANVRSAPNPLASDILRKVFNNEPLNIVGEEHNPASGQLYFKVSVQGITGFVDNELVSTSCNVSPAAFIPKTAVSRVICNPDSDFTNMRLGPNKDMFDVVSRLDNGTAIRVLEATTNPVSQQPWFKIEAAGDVGFVDSDYVKDGC